MALHSVSICTGLAGIERGLDAAAPGAFEPVLYCEREISVVAVLAQEIEAGRLPAAPIWSDVKTLCRGSVARYLDRVGVDCITGGYPCQPFSVAGRRRGEDDPRHLWPWIARAVERYRPSLCFFENVEGHLILGFEDVAEQLQALGYRVAAGLFTASEVGASHRRERLFILGVANDQGKRRGQVERRTSGNAGHVAECGDELVDGNASGLRRKGHKEQSSGHAVEGSGNVADPTRNGDSRQHGESGSGGRVCEAGDTVGDTEQSGLQGGERFRGAEVSGDGCLPVYPPGPGLGSSTVVEKVLAAFESGDEAASDRFLAELNELANWEQILSRFPELAPAITGPTPQSDFRQLADGLSRADQLRAYGNAVVPHCADVAFLALFGALYDEVK